MLYISYYLFAVLRHVPLNKDLQALIICNIKFPTIMVPTKIILPKIISQNHSVLLCSIFMFGKQGGANQYILHLWWAASAVLLDMGIAK